MAENRLNYGKKISNMGYIAADGYVLVFYKLLLQFEESYYGDIRRTGPSVAGHAYSFSRQIWQLFRRNNG